MGEARLRLTASLKYKNEDLEYFYTLLKSLPHPPFTDPLSPKPNF
jgi:hypothetical protein